MGKKLLTTIVAFGIAFGFAGIALALPYYSQTQSMIPGSDTVNNNLGTTSPANLRYNGFFNNVTISGTCTGCSSNTTNPPFTASTNYNQTVSATGTPLWLQAGLMASSTAFFTALTSTYGTTTYASSTALTATNLVTSNATTTALGWIGILDKVLYTNHAGNTIGVATTSVSAGTGLTGTLTTLGSADAIALTIPVAITSGGTGTTTSVSGWVFYGGGNGTTHQAVATSSVTFNSPFTTTGTAGYQIGGSSYAVNCQNATIAQTGCLTSTDFTTFNNKQAPGFQISTTSALTISNIAYYTNVTGTTIGGVATSTTGTASTVAFLDSNQHITIPYATSTAITVSGQIGIPNASTSPTLTAGSNTADLKVDSKTASSSLRFADGAATRALYPDLTKGTVFASSTLTFDGAFGASGSTTLALLNSFRPLTLLAIACRSDVGTAWVAFGNGTATTTAVQCNNPVASVSLSTNNTWTMLQTVFIEIGHSASSPNNLTVSAQVRQDAD